MNEFQKQLERSRALTRSLHSFDINLAIAAADKEYSIAGNLIYIIHAPDHLSYIDIRFNEISNPKHRLVLMLGLRAYHERIFVTTPAGQAGNITILHGIVDPELFAVIDNRSAGIGDMLEELRGDLTHEDFTGLAITAAPGASEIMAVRTDRKAGFIQALSTNTGSVFLGFADTVTVGGAPGIWFAELQPGMGWTCDDYRGPVYGIATAAQVVGMGEW